MRSTSADNAVDNAGEPTKRTDNVGRQQRDVSIARRSNAVAKKGPSGKPGGPFFIADQSGTLTGMRPMFLLLVLALAAL